LRFASIGLIVMAFLGFPCEMYGGDLRLGPLRIIPYITASGRYTDNVFLTERNEKSDFSYSVLPGVKLRIPTIGRYGFHFNYEADYAQYDTHHEANYLIQSAEAALDLNLPKRFGVKLGDKITSGADLPDFDGDRKARYLSNVARIGTSYAFFDRFNLGLHYSHEFKDYQRSEDEIDNFDTHALGGVLRFRMLFEYGYATTNYRKDRVVENSYSNQVNSGITWDITAKTHGTVRGGYVEKNYYALNRKEDAVFASANISHELTSRTIFTLSGIRSVFDTSQADDNINYSSSFLSNQVSATLRHTYRKFTGGIGGDFIYDRYLHDDLRAMKRRRDTVWRGSVGIDYQMQRWIKMGVQYRYTNLNSNFSNEDYVENLGVFLVGITL
jgi:hypothetical protein